MNTEHENQALPLPFLALRLRAVVLALGESASPAWWKTEFLNETGLRFLDRLYPRTSVHAAVHAAAKCGDVVTITFTASETLSGNPTVTVNGHSVSNLSHTGNDYTCTYTIQENNDSAGEATIHIAEPVPLEFFGKDGIVAHVNLDTSNLSGRQNPPCQIPIRRSGGPP